MFCFSYFYKGRKSSFNLCCLQRELLLFIGEVASILYRAGFICFLDPLFSLDFCCVYFLFTLCLSCFCQYMTNGGEIDEMWESCLFCLVCIFVICFSLIIYCLYVLFSKNAVMCFLQCFQERQVHYDQYLLPLIATSRLGVLDQNFCCIWAFLLYWVVLIFEYFILYVSFVTNCQRGRLLGSKSLEKLANCEHKFM